MRRVGVDIGGTFTDLILVDDATGAFAVGKTLTTPDDPSQAVETVLVDAARRGTASTPADDRPGHPRHDAGHQRDHRAQGRAAPRCSRRTASATRSRSAASTATTCTTSTCELPDAARAALPALRRAERTLADGTRSQALDVAYVERARRASWREAGIEAVAICFLHSLRQPGRTSGRRATAVLRVAPGMRVSLSSEVVPEIREYERTSTTVANVYVQGRVERYLRELRASGSRALGFGGALLHDALERRHRDAGDGDALPGPAARVGPGGRRARRRAPTAPRPASPTCCRSTWAAPPPSSCVIDGRRAADRARVRGRPRATASRRAPACRSRSPVDRDDRDRRRRRLDRARRRARPAQGRARLARAPTRARSATAAAAPSRPSPTPTWCSATSTPASSSAAGMALDLDAARDARSPSASREPLGLTRRGGRLGHPPDRQREHGQRRARARARARQGPARPAAVRVRRRRARCTRFGVARGARRADADRAVRRRRDGDGRLPGRAAGVRLRALVRRRRSTTLDWDARRTRCSPRWRPRATRCWRAPASRAERRSRTRREADMRYAGQGHEIRVDPWPREPRRRPPSAPRSSAEYERLYGRLGPDVSARGDHLARVVVGPAARASRCARRRASRGDALKGERQA